MDPMYDLETERVASEIKDTGARRVFLQLPDGLRPVAISLTETLRELTGAEILISGDSCYGACDLALIPAREIGADLIVHYGHSRMLETETPVIYIEAKVGFDAPALVEKALPHISRWGKTGLATTVQHAHKLEAVKEALEGSGVEVEVGGGGGRTVHPGQVLGCNYETAEEVSGIVDGFLFIGAGRFHALGLAMSTGRPVVIANPYLMEVDELDEREVTRFAMKRMAAITYAKGVETLGIIVSVKRGQNRMAVAEELRGRLEKGGKRAPIIVLDEVNALSLGNFTEVEAFIDTACPRIAVDGLAGLTKPILTITEAQIMLGERRWEDTWGRGYINDQRVYNKAKQ